MKKLVTGILALILVISSLCFIGGCQVQSATENKNESVISFPEALTFTSTALASAQESGEQGVTATLLAEIQPADANNKNVTWTIAWKEDAALKDEDVSEYLIGKADENNLLRFNLTCLKSFSGSEIIVTVTTEDGAYSAECYINFIERINRIYIADMDNDSRITTDERGTYYLSQGGISTGRVETVFIGFESESNKIEVDLDVSVSAVGQFYAANCIVQNESYWSADIAWDETSIRLVNLNDNVLDYIRCSIYKTSTSEYQLWVEPGAGISGGYTKEPERVCLDAGKGQNTPYNIENVIVTDHCKRMGATGGFVYIDANVTEENTAIRQALDFNKEAVKSFLFIITITDNYSGLSIDIPWYFSDYIAS